MSGGILNLVSGRIPDMRMTGYLTRRDIRSMLTTISTLPLLWYNGRVDPPPGIRYSAGISPDPSSGQIHTPRYNLYNMYVMFICLLLLLSQTSMVSSNLDNYINPIHSERRYIIRILFPGQLIPLDIACIIWGNLLEIWPEISWSLSVRHCQILCSLYTSASEQISRTDSI